MTQINIKVRPSFASEREWLTCNEPQKLSDFGRAHFDTQRFRWLAVEWGNRIRHIFEPHDLIWFDAFAAWVAGNGDHPSQVCLHPEYYSLDYPTPVLSWARNCARAIRSDNPMDAASCASNSASEDYPHAGAGVVDFTKSHRGRATAKRLSVKAQHEAWSLAKNQRVNCIQQEFCAQFRDITGNPFRPVEFRPEWLTSDVVGLSSVIDATGYFDRLPILADALEEAGCTSEDVLRHCREQELHVRGCWVIDNLLGRVKSVQV